MLSKPNARNTINTMIKKLLSRNVDRQRFQNCEENICIPTNRNVITCWYPDIPTSLSSSKQINMTVFGGLCYLLGQMSKIRMWITYFERWAKSGIGQPYCLHLYPCQKAGIFVCCNNLFSLNRSSLLFVNHPSVLIKSHFTPNITPSLI